MNYNIEVAVEEGTSTTAKGQLLENLCVEILKAQQFSVTERIRVTGIEIDLLAEHNLTTEKIIVECKAWESPLPADVVTKLLGNVFLRNVTAGWLVSTGDLGKDAEGIRSEWETKPSEERRKLSFYTKERIIKLLIDNGIVIDSGIIKYHVGSSYKLSDNHNLLITEYGRFWIIPVVLVTAGISMSVLVFDAKTGERISDYSVISKLKQTKNSFIELEWPIEEAVSPATTKLIENEFQNIVTVMSGDDWTDYRPSRPEDFVGRKNIISDIFAYFNSVVNRSTETRLFAIKSPSGWGKSSIVLKIVDMAKNRKRTKNYYVYAVDVRTAMSSRYAELALKACLEAALKDNFIKLPSKEVDICNVANVFNDSLIIDIMNQLRENNKLIVLIFDQFEETFSKKELSTLFDSIRKLSIAVDAQKENIILGFAWKTDLSIPADHAAYYMWSSLLDRRKEFELPQFTAREINSAINVFGKQLSEQINPVLKRYLTEQCQGYPWLLKKLCIHVYFLITAGAGQGAIIGQRLSIKDLFEKDLNELTPSETGCITEVAKDSPADFFKVTEIYGHEVVQSLINKRLLIRRASKLILYWDIFRDYVLSKTIPPIVLNYIPQQQFTTIMKVIKVLLKTPSISIDNLSIATGLNKSTIDNMLIDMVIFGIAQRSNEEITLIVNTEKGISESLYEFFKNHIIYKHLQQIQGDKFDYEMFWNIFQKIYEQSNLNPKTQQTYSTKLFGWFIKLGLFSELDGSYRLNEGRLKTIFFNEEEQTSSISRKQRRSLLKKSSIFLGQTSPNKVKKVFNLIENTTNDRVELKKLGYRNALEILSALNMIEFKGEKVLLLGDYNTFIAKVISSPTMQFCLEVMEKNLNINGKHLGALINERFKRNWSKSSEKRYGGALLLWGKHLKGSNN